MVVASPPKLDDVASLAGVSTATVSRCLNTPELVAESTRERVIAAVKELGYTPNFGARALAAKRSYTIGAVIPTMENAFFALGLQAFQQRLSEENFDLLVATSNYKLDQEEKQIRSLVSKGAEGLLLIGTNRDPALYDYLDERQIPFVIAWTFDDRSDAPYSNHFVGFDNEGAMYEIVSKVIEMGHTNLAMISGLQEDNDRAQGRVKGFKSALRDNNIDPSSAPIIEADYHFDSGRDAFARLLEFKTNMTVVICANDVLAAGALMEANDRNISVPDDISITGFDDIEIASILQPKLTTVRVPHRAMGRQAASSLLSQINDKTPSNNFLLPTFVVERFSLKTCG